MAASIEQAAGEAGSDALAALLRVALNDDGSLVPAQVRSAIGGSLSLPDYQVYQLGSTIYASALTSGLTTYSGSSTDAGAVIQQAIDLLKANQLGGTIAIRGSLPLATGITTYPAIGIVGQGPLSAAPFGTSQFVATSAVTGPIFTVKIDAANPTWQYFPFLSNFSLVGTHAQTGQDGIFIDNSNGVIFDFYLQHVQVFDVGGNGLNNTSAGKVWIDQCYFEHCQKNGIRDSASTIRVTKCYIFGNGLWGIDTTSNGYTMASHNLFGENGQAAAIGSGGGFQMGSSGSAGQVTNNDFFDNGPTGGYAVHPSTQVNTGRWKILGNDFKDTRGGSAVANFIYTSDNGAVNALIQGNSFVGMTGQAVRVRFNNAGENVRIKDNLGFNPLGKITAPLSTANNSIGIIGLSTTATGVNALNSAIVNCGSTTGFPASGTFLLAGVAVTYSGVTSTSFTGCGNHAATTGGEAIVPCPVASTDYTIREVDQNVVVAGGTSVSITIKDNAGNTVSSGAATMDRMLPIGWKVNLGAFTGTPPTLDSFGN